MHIEEEVYCLKSGHPSKSEMAHCVAFLQDRHTVEASQWAQHFWRTFSNLDVDLMQRLAALLTFFAFSKPAQNFAFWLKFEWLNFLDFWVDMVILISCICFVGYLILELEFRDHCVFLWQWLQDHKSFREKETKNWWWTFFSLNTRPGDSYWSLTKLTSQKDPGSFLLPLQFSRSFARDRAERRTILENDHNSAAIFCLLRSYACLPNQIWRQFINLCRGYLQIYL